MLMVRRTAILLNVIVFSATLFMFFADERGFSSREIMHYVLIGLFVVTSAVSVSALWPPNGRIGTRRGTP
jgi:hypothetical protein